MDTRLTDIMLFSSEESRNIDSKTIQDFGFDSFTLMETAALGASQIILSEQGDQQRGLYICGKGNNAGDALAVARILSNQYDHKIDFYFPLGTDGLSDDTRKNYDLLLALKDNDESINWLNNLNGTAFSQYDYVVDGLFGTGISRNIEGSLHDTIQKLNASKAPVYSMDIPSGLSGDTGKIMGISVQATCTITFGTRKLGLYLETAPKYSGKIHFVPLQFPSRFLDSSILLLSEKLFNSLPKVNRSARHKYDQGVVHILAGSEGLTGAAITACRSAWKNGAGAVFLYAPRKILPVYESVLPEIIKIPLGDDTDAHYKFAHANKIISTINEKPGILITGPGVGTSTETLSCIWNVLKNYGGKAVIDADAISLWDKLKELAQREQNNWILTPHIGEAKKYMDADFSDDLSRLKWSKKTSEIFNCPIVMKGNPTYLTTPESGSFLTEYPTDMFAKAGFGDQLAGAVAAQAEIRDSLKDAAIFSLYNSYRGYLQKDLNSPFTPESLL
jgi:NAD(P)H-hydrate epimerase